MSYGRAGAGLRELIVTLDLEDYVEASIVRRIRRRMESLDIGDPRAYRDYVRSSPGELDSLRSILQISHTGFFRDQPRWDALAESVVPELLARKERVRVWSAGCATGEEAYTLAMVFCEKTGIADLSRRVAIFATDTCATSLATAREGSYSAQRRAAVPEPLREKYFVGGAFRPDLRSIVRFARHDVLNDAPFMRMDLIVCRNMLLYMRREAQAHVLAKLHLALAEKGVLFTGPADGLPVHRHLFRRAGVQLHHARTDAKRVALLAAGARRS